MELEEELEADIKCAKYLGVMTNEMWETEEDRKVEDDHVSVSHPRVLRKVENVEGELRLKQK